MLTAADRNLWELFGRMADAVPAGRREVDGSLALLSTGSPIGFFNPAMPTGAVDPETTVARVAEHYSGLGLPYVVLFRDDVAPGLAEACASSGMVEHWQMPLMVLDPIPADHGSATVVGLEIVVVGPDEIDTYGDVVSEGFGMPAELFTQLGRSMFDVEGFIGLLGLLDGRPVATSAAFVDGDTIGVYNVAVPEAERRKGLGEALTAAAARAGADAGATRSILQASQLGAPVYRRMGYETPDRYRQFEPAPA